MHVINIGRIHGIVDATVPYLRGKRMLTGPRTLDNAFITVESDKITAIGGMEDFVPSEGEKLVDAHGGIVIPSFCDSHTHIIYAGSREGEFVDKIQGLSYEEIARRGGGILNSADRLHDTSEQELFDSALYRARLMMERGTGAFEVKTGYGLNTADELKMLRVAARLRESVEARVKITFLGAHAVGRAFAGRQSEYVDMVIREMLPAIAAEGIADYVDVFCDTGFFTPEETARIIEAAAPYGMKAKIHANELGISGGVQVATAKGAVSADHLEQLGDEEISLLSRADTVATMLPGASFFSRLPFGRARMAVDSDAIVALASDYNPGSSPSGDMRFVWALGCIRMGLLPAEALTACTLNGAAAMELGRECGAIAAGRDASFIIVKPGISLDYIPYAYTEPFIATHIIRGHIA